MLDRLFSSNSYGIILMLIFSVLMMACASNKYDANGQPVEPSLQERVTQCAKIADRSERDRCMYG